MAITLHRGATTERIIVDGQVFDLGSMPWSERIAALRQLKQSYCEAHKLNPPRRRRRRRSARSRQTKDNRNA